MFELLKMPKLIAFAFLFGLASMQANADFMSTDWKNANDRLATLDTETGIEWLDLTQTLGKSIADINSLLSTTYRGWRLPSNTEIIQLMTKMFPMYLPYAATTPLNGSGTAGRNAAWTFSNLFLTGVTTLPRWAEGLFIRDNGIISMTGVYYGTNSQYWTPNNSYEFADNSRMSHIGVYLVSDGGTTLSSINNPSLNVNNPRSPVNQMPDAPANVPVHIGFGVLGFLLIGLGFRKQSGVIQHAK